MLFICVSEAKHPPSPTLHSPFPCNPSHLAADNTKKSIAIFVLLLKGNQSARAGEAKGMNATRCHSPSSLPVEQSPIIFSRAHTAAQRRIGYAIPSRRSILPPVRVRSTSAPRSVRSSVQRSIHSCPNAARAAFQPPSPVTCSPPLQVLTDDRGVKVKS